MSIEQLYTTQISIQASKASSADVDALTATHLQGALAGGNFFDVFLANLAAANEKAKDENADETVLTSNTPALEEDPELFLKQILEGNADIDLSVDENLEAIIEKAADLDADVLTFLNENGIAVDRLTEEETNFALNLNARIFENLLESALKDVSSDLSTQKTSPSDDSAIDKLLNFLNADNNDEDSDNLFDVLTALFADKTDESEQIEDYQEAALLMLNMTPQEITDLKQQIHDIVNSNAATGTAQSPSDIITNLKALLIGDGAEIVQSLDSRYINGKTVRGKDFKDHLDDASKSNIDVLEELKTSGEAKLKDTDLVSLKEQSSNQKPVSFDPATLIENFDSLVTTLFEAPQTTTTTSASPFSLQALSSNLIQAPHAAELHPGSHMVAMQIQKAAQEGRNKVFTLRLDPPDLGRVEIRMEFGGKEKTVKAMMTVEKPETYAMLQRDAQALERSLQDMGLDLESGIGFELLQDSNDFMGNNRRGGGHDHSGAHGAGGDASVDQGEDILEASLEWLVDPETGHTHYDLWA